MYQAVISSCQGQVGRAGEESQDGVGVKAQNTTQHNATSPLQSARDAAPAGAEHLLPAKGQRGATGRELLTRSSSCRGEGSCARIERSPALSDWRGTFHVVDWGEAMDGWVGSERNGET